MEQYKQELVKSFHQQFAENQNNHQSAFIQMLSIILTVIVGFGLALLNFGGTSTDKDFNLTLFDFTIAFCIAEGILTLVGSDKASENARLILEKFRADSLPIIHIQHIAAAPTATFFLPDTKGAEIHDNVKPLGRRQFAPKTLPLLLALD